MGDEGDVDREGPVSAGALEGDRVPDAVASDHVGGVALQDNRLAGNRRDDVTGKQDLVSGSSLDGVDDLGAFAGEPHLVPGTLECDEHSGVDGVVHRLEIGAGHLLLRDAVRPDDLAVDEVDPRVELCLEVLEHIDFAEAHGEEEELPRGFMGHDRVVDIHEIDDLLRRTG